jgi:exodeoxyribonuclease V alpha subunit
MSENLQMLLELHQDRGRFPERLVEQVQELNQDASAIILAWELSGLAPGLDRSGRDRLFAVCLALRVSQGQGHTRMALVPAEGSPAELLIRAAGLGPFDLEAFLASVPAIAGRPGAARPLIMDGGWLYSQRMLDYEEDLAARLRNLSAKVDLETVPVAEDIILAPNPLNPRQRAAVEMAMRGSLTLVTGGPGTGKTTIVVSMLRALLRQGTVRQDIALAAPTGKAAQRMGESIRNGLAGLVDRTEAEQEFIDARVDPETLHRLLVWHPAAERFRHGPENTLPHKVLIIDESSMISQEHLCRLVGALDRDARLVLLGDADQLPSVEAGCAFLDMVKRLGANCVELTESYRMDKSNPNGRNIYSVAQSIRSNRAADLWEGPEPIHCRAALDQLEHARVELLDPAPGVMKAFLARWFAREVTGLDGFQDLAGRVFSFRGGIWGDGDEAALKALFGHFDGFRILCALREGPDHRGVEDINRLLHGWMGGITGKGLQLATPFCAGEPVLMTANDYRREIFNGDQGLILKVAFDDGPLYRQAAVFPKGAGWAAYPLEPLKQRLEHAYAMTVHKSQGSEYARIAIVLPPSNHKALTRELLYTGLTRAKQSVVLLAERERIAFAAGNPSRRESGLAERLGPAAGGPVV